MEPLSIFLISACILTMAIGYVTLKVRHYGENKDAIDKLSQAQAEIVQVKHKLDGCTKYEDYLEAGKQAMSEHFKPVKVVREYTHLERIPKDMEGLKLRFDVNLVAKYSVDFTFGLDLIPSTFEVIAATNGVGIKINRPTLLGSPFVKLQSHEVVSREDLPDEKIVLAYVKQKFTAKAQNFGNAIATEEAIRALCMMKLLECFRDFLDKQTGIRLLPAIFVEYK